MSSALAATLYANRAAAHVALSNWEAAVSDAQAAVTLQPEHSKAFHRLATALCALGRFREAVKACRSGAAALAATGDRSNVFQLLMDQVRSPHASAVRRATDVSVLACSCDEQVSTAAALNGSIAAFDGRILHVRSAGEDAWLCKEAPLSVEHDVVEPEPTVLLASEDTDLWAGAKAVSSGAMQARDCLH